MAAYEADWDWRLNLELTVFYFGIHSGTTVQPSKILLLFRSCCCLYEYFFGNIHFPNGPLEANNILELILSLLQLQKATIRNRQWTLPRQRRFIRRRYYNLVKYTMHSTLYLICPPVVWL